ncbi:MAG: hypothetical protein RL220_1495 [Bacteroidota bacterium]
MKRLFWFVLGCVMLAACSDKQQVQLLPDAIRGLASPLKLGHDTTTIRLFDYFSDLRGITSVTITEARMAAMPGFDFITVMDTVDGEITIKGNFSASPLYNLRVIKQGEPYDIPVYPSDKQEIKFTYAGDPGARTAEMAGSINGWNPKATPLTKDSSGWSTNLVLSPGRYPYQLVVDGTWKLNPEVSETLPNGQGGFNSVLKVGDPDYLKPIIYVKHCRDSVVYFGVDGDPKNIQVSAYLQNTLIASPTVTGGTFEVVLPAGLKGRHSLRVYAANEKARTNDLMMPLTDGKVIVDTNALNRHDYHRNIMYFMMVDRFADGNKINNRPTLDISIHPKANNLGGDLSGIQQKLNDGYFKELGINTLWISPISRNAEGAWGLWTKGVTSKFSGYHGYWPTCLRAVDDRFGTGDDLSGLLKESHDRDMNVILDFVAHHVHQQHPLYQQHPDWATQLYLPDGTLNTERWDEHRLTTWFDVFLPTWDFSRPEVRLALADSAMYWLRNYELDGFRHDATKHVPVEFWRDLTKQIKSEIDRPVYQIGETYGNPELIGSYVNSGQMDGQFDFNLYDAAVDAFANDGRGFENLGRTLNQSLEAYGSHHLMGNITGNQDRARFASYADGSVSFSEDPKLAGWTRDIQNAGDAGFRKMENLMAFIMTIPGIPCIYYGDEIAMPGGNDPDNRRMMKFDGLNENQLKTREITSKLASLRSSNMALLYGQTFILRADEKALVIARKYMNEMVLTVFASGQGTIEVELPVHLAPDSWTPHFGNQPIESTRQKLKLEFKGAGFEVLTSFYRKG